MPGKKKLDTVQVGCRVRASIHKRMYKLNPVIGTITTEILNQFIAVKEFETAQNSSALICEDGSIIYAVDILDDNFHFTLKSGGEIITSELSDKEIAGLALHLIELLNKSAARKQLSVTEN